MPASLFVTSSSLYDSRLAHRLRRGPYEAGVGLSTEGRSVQATGCRDRKSTRLNSSHTVISYAVFCLKKKKRKIISPYYLHTVLTRGRDTDLTYRSSLT